MAFNCILIACKCKNCRNKNKRELGEGKTRLASQSGGGFNN